MLSTKYSLFCSTFALFDDEVRHQQRRECVPLFSGEVISIELKKYFKNNPRLNTITIYG